MIPKVGRNIHYRTAIQASAHRRYSQRPLSRLGAPVVVRAGAAFALLVPAQYTAETQPPESGLHPHTHDIPAVVGLEPLPFSSLSSSW